MKSKRPKPKTKIVRVDLTEDDQRTLKRIMSEQLLDPTRPGAERVSQQSAILHAVRRYAAGVGG